MKPATEIGKKMVELIFAKQRVLVEMNARLKRIEHGLVEIELPKS